MSRRIWARHRRLSSSLSSIHCHRWSSNVRRGRRAHQCFQSCRWWPIDVSTRSSGRCRRPGESQCGTIDTLHAKTHTHTHDRAMDFWISREIPSLSKTREDLFFHVKTERCWRVDVAVWIANFSANSELFKFILLTLRQQHKTQESGKVHCHLTFINDYTMRKTFVTISSEFSSPKGRFNSRSKSSLSPFQFAWAFQHHNTLSLFFLDVDSVGMNGNFFRISFLSTLFLFIQLSAWWYISMLMTDDNSFTIFFSSIWYDEKVRAQKHTTHSRRCRCVFESNSSTPCSPFNGSTRSAWHSPLNIRLEFIWDSRQDMKLEHVNYSRCDRSFSVLLLSLEHVSKDFPTRSVEETRSKSSRDDRPTTTLFFSIEFFRCCWTLSRSHIHPRHRHRRRWAAMLSCRAI